MGNCKTLNMIKIKKRWQLVWLNCETLLNIRYSPLSALALLICTAFPDATNDSGNKTAIVCLKTYMYKEFGPPTHRSILNGWEAHCTVSIDPLTFKIGIPSFFLNKVINLRWLWVESGQTIHLVIETEQKLIRKCFYGSDRKN